MAAGIPLGITRGVLRCEEELQHVLMRNIVLGGGNCRLPGLAARLQYELPPLLPYDLQGVRVTTADDTLTSAWRGAAMVASLSTFPSMCVSCEEYEEFGPNIVTRKCF